MVNNKRIFLIYKIESMFLLALFVGTFVFAVSSQQVGWIVVGWLASAIMHLHLRRVRCPYCNLPAMRRSAPKIFQSKWFTIFPNKCGACNKKIIGKY